MDMVFALHIAALVKFHRVSQPDRSNLWAQSQKWKLSTAECGTKTKPKQIQKRKEIITLNLREMCDICF